MKPIRRVILKIIIGTTVSVAALWAIDSLMPIPASAREFTVSGLLYHVEHERTRKRLPLNEWGILPGTLIMCGSNGGETTRTTKFGCFAVVDRTSTHFTVVDPKIAAKYPNPAW